MSGNLASIVPPTPQTKRDPRYIGSLFRKQIPMPLLEIQFPASVRVSHSQLLA